MPVKDKSVSASAAAAATSAAAAITASQAPSSSAAAGNVSSSASPADAAGAAPGFSYAMSFKTTNGGAAASTPAGYSPVLSEVELTKEHALAETMVESIAAYNSTPPKRKRMTMILMRF